MNINMSLKARTDEVYAHVFDDYLDGYGSEALVGALRPWITVEPAPRVPDWSASPGLWSDAIGAGNLFLLAKLDRNVAKVFRHAATP